MSHDKKHAPLPADVLAELLRAIEEPHRNFDGLVQEIIRRHPGHAEEIEGFLAAARAAVVAGGQTDPPIDDEGIPDDFAGYRILDRIGQGGMGVVYLAEQREPVSRRVALKVVRRDLGIDSRALAARFEIERAALARMEHSAIAKVFDAGVHEGQPYMAMEYVKGIPITRYCDENKLSIPDRLALFLEVCSGVQHAHLKGVIHRDLTPANVMVTLQDGQPSVRIIDFGLAKGNGILPTGTAVVTKLGAIMGTPAYMSPEQAGSGVLDVDTRSDVYTLGVLLYELVTGSLPFEPSELETSRDPLLIIRERDPERPSTRVTTGQRGLAHVASRRRIGTRELIARLRSDLDWVILKCLEKDRTRRYETVSQLADDIRRYLQDTPVSARTPHWRYQVSKVLRRHRRAFVAIGAAVLLMITGAVVSTTFWIEAKAANRKFDTLMPALELVHLEDAPTWPRYPVGAARDACAAFSAQFEKIAAAVPEAKRVIAEADSDPTATPGHRALAKHMRDFLDAHDRFADGRYRECQREARWLAAVEEITLGGTAAAKWEAARAAIAVSDKYAGADLRLTPQVGLLPIGCNPATGLWEFYDLRSAWDGLSEPRDVAIPTFGESGHIRGTEALGVVFVLIPGGTFAMGAQSEADSEPNFDPAASPEESPVHTIRVQPFLLARHELTQGQWSRLTIQPNPSWYPAGNLHAATGEVTDGRHPVDSLSRHDAERFLAESGWRLPSEAEWEYAARGAPAAAAVRGEPTLWSMANLADAAVARKLSDFAAESWDDGWAGPAPVGHFRPNTLGLYDTVGNVAEWVADPFRHYSDRQQNEEDSGVVRGGSYMDVARFARVSYRLKERSHSASNLYGVRPARTLTP